ncbi:MAG: toprim domain-containing protein [Acidimicrobiales bacterium]
MTDRGQRRPRWAIEDVVARTDLARLLDELAQPATHAIRGRRWHCPVPDHADHHASVTMHTDHRGHERWRCWSGDDTHRGDAIDLVVATQRMTRGEAIDWLANRAGMIPDRPLPPITRKPRPTLPAVVPLAPAVVRYVQACERILWTPTGRRVRDWLHERGFNDDTIRANRVGADPGRQLMRRPRGLPHGTSTAATFSVLAPDGHLTYVQTRYLAPGDDSKYDNPAAALGTNPRLAWTRQPSGQGRAGLLLVCEGIPDALTAAQGGYAAVGILGSQAPDRVVAARLAHHADRHHQRLVAVIDADPAGRRWGEHLGQLLRGDGLELTVIGPPDGHDLNSWACDDQNWTVRIALGRELADVPLVRAPRAITDVGIGPS